MQIKEDAICIQLTDEYGSTWIWKCGFPNISFASGNRWWIANISDIVHYDGQDKVILRVKEFITNDTQRQ